MVSTSHVVVLDGDHKDSSPGHFTVRCDHCGIRVAIKLPVAVVEFNAIIEGFAGRHRDCSIGGQS